MKLDFFHYLQV